MILERNGRLLCSPRNPQKEAQDWLLRQKVNEKDRTALVLGYGAGFHVQELQKQFPHLKIEIYEMDPKLRDDQFHFVQNIEANNYDVILPFRPAWAGYEKEYLSHYLRLTSRDQNPDLIFQSDASELKIWQCLRELVK